MQDHMMVLMKVNILKMLKYRITLMGTLKFNYSAGIEPMCHDVCELWCRPIIHIFQPMCSHLTTTCISESSAATYL